jgi:hypothetical protein
LKGPYVKKRRDALVLLLDDAFDAPEIPRLLLAGGYSRVERFTTHFPGQAKKSDPSVTIREQGVIDPRVISLCNQRRWLLITTDSEIRYTQIEAIKRSANVAILATSHNAAVSPIVWIEALITARFAIERKWKKQQTPWYGQFDRSGRITTCYTVTAENKTRRNRPREQELAAVR